MTKRLLVWVGIAAVMSAQIACVRAQRTAVPDQPANSSFIFDVVSVHLHTHLPHEHSSIYNSANNGSFRTVNVSLAAIVEYAFDIPQSRVLDMPEWMKSERFDIDAKSDASVNDSLSKLSFDQAKPLKLGMIQALLKERFKLAVHRDGRELPVYELVVAKSGAKLLPAKVEGLSISDGRGHLNAQGLTMAGLAQELAQYVQLVVVDKTGLAGRFDIDLQFAPDDAIETALPSIYTALQEQLGLKLQSAKGMVDVLVVSHVERPSAN